MLTHIFLQFYVPIRFLFFLQIYLLLIFFLSILNSFFIKKAEYTYEEQTRPFFDVHLSWIFCSFILPVSALYPRLSSPITLTINNLSQLIEIISQQADQFSQLEYPDDNDENVNLKRNIYKQKYIKYKLGTYVKQNELEIIKSQADFDFNLQQKPREDEGGGSSY